jgi:putative MATE family efflux protein
MQGTGDTIHPMITQGTGAIINIILDPIFIFGYFGVPKMGVAGAAIATILGQWAAMGLSLFFMLRKTPELQFKFKGFRPKKRVIKEIYQVGLPSMIMQSIGSVMTISMNTILISFTATAVAVFGVYFKLQSFIFLPVFGLAAAMISIVAFNYGARDKERIIKTIKNAIAIVFLVMMVGLAIFQFFPRFLLELFNASPEMMEIGMKALRIISLAFPLAGIAIVLSSSFQALGKGFYSLFVSIIRQLVVLLPSAYLLSILSGLDAVWFAFLISEIVCLVVSLWLYARLYRRNIQTLDLHPETAIPPQSIENN